jgi:DNA-binding transcriptional MocR family regulator
MSRRPVDQISKAAKPQGQDGIWAEIKHQTVFTVTELVKATDINRKTVSDYVKRLEAGGYVEKCAGFETNPNYFLRRDGGVHAPRIRKDGSPVTQGGGVANMWRSMRMLSQFTPRDLALHSTTDTVSVSEATAKSYCSMLLKARYLRVTQKAKPGKRQTTYKFIRNTGPKPPQIQRVKQVFDPNLNMVTYSPGDDA